MQSIEGLGIAAFWYNDEFYRPPASMWQVYRLTEGQYIPAAGDFRISFGRAVARGSVMVFNPVRLATSNSRRPC